MLLESLKPLQLKSNVILCSNDVVNQGTTTQVPGNSKRHSLIFGTNVGNITLRTNASNYVFNFDAAGFFYVKMNWDDFGNEIKKGFSVTWPVAANAFYLVETYIEEAPVTP